MNDNKELHCDVKHEIEALKAEAESKSRTKTRCLRCTHCFDTCMSRQEEPCRYETFIEVLEELENEK